MFKTENETDLHYKVVDYIRRFYPEAIIVAGLGELQDTPSKRTDSWKKGYTKGQPDLIRTLVGAVLSLIHQVSQGQKELKHRYNENGYYFLLSNDYDLIAKNIHDFMEGVRLPCKFCNRDFLSKETRKRHYKIIHGIEK